MAVRFDTTTRVALLLGSCVASAVLVTGSALGVALKPPKAVATSTQVFGSADPTIAGDTLISWYSSDGTTAVVTTENAAGRVVSVEKDQFSIHGQTFTNAHTVLFPSRERGRPGVNRATAPRATTTISFTRLHRCSLAFWLRMRRL
jgi:hypothetical protein